MLSRLSPVWLFATIWTIAHQGPLSMGFSRQEYWSGLSCPPPGDLPNPGIKPESLMSLALAGGFFFFFLPLLPPGKPNIWCSRNPGNCSQHPGNLTISHCYPQDPSVFCTDQISKCNGDVVGIPILISFWSLMVPYFFLVLDGDSNLQERTISFIFTIFLGRGCSMTSTWSFPLC